MDDFHATILYEAAGHGSQAVKRLAMMSSDVPRFGSAEYARLELIAELVSAQLGAQLALPMGPSLIASHAGYLASWLQVLKGDKNEIFKAAASAQKICDYVSKLAVEAQPFVARDMAASKSDVLSAAAEQSESGEMVHHRSPVRERAQEQNRRPRAAC